tara:strand:- start:133 stop:408 length:276 start_codon:yes stop_codon:yes gene_type:complete
MTIKKIDIAKKISSDLSISVTDAKNITESFINCIKNFSSSGDVKLSRFGTFKLKLTTKRIGRNPKTIESYIIYPREKLILVVSNKIKSLIN